MPHARSAALPASPGNAEAGPPEGDPFSTYAVSGAAGAVDRFRNVVVTPAAPRAVVPGTKVVLAVTATRIAPIGQKPKGASGNSRALRPAARSTVPTISLGIMLRAPAVFKPSKNRRVEPPVPPDAHLAPAQPDRPGQLRGVTPLAPALPIFAQLRRFTSATLTAAEVKRAALDREKTRRERAARLPARAVSAPKKE